MKINYLIKTISLLTAAIGICATASCVSSPSVGHRIDGKVYPTARPVLDENGQPRKDLFISPYRPYNPIDTRGYRSGSIVGDPSTAKKNDKGELVLSTVKAFRLP